MTDSWTLSFCGEASLGHLPANPSATVFAAHTPAIEGDSNKAGVPVGRKGMQKNCEETIGTQVWGSRFWDTWRSMTQEPADVPKP